MLRGYWCRHQHPVWIFPVAYHQEPILPTAKTYMGMTSVGQAFRSALQHCGTSQVLEETTGGAKVARYVEAEADHYACGELLHGS